MNKIKRRFRDQKGLTMMEIMVVIFILTLFLGLVSSRLRTGTSSDLNNQIRDFGILGRQLRAKARVHDRTYRMVFEFPTAEDRQNDQHQYNFWIEYSPHRVFLPDPEQEEDWASMDEDQLNQDQGFQMDASMGEEKRPLPQGLRVAQVELDGYDNPVQEGQAMIHFFPNGRVEESVVHFSWGEAPDETTRRWTLYFRPFTGDPEIFGDHIPLNRLKVTP